jgi:hypothetical protein
LFLNPVFSARIPFRRARLSASVEQVAQSLHPRSLERSDSLHWPQIKSQRDFILDSMDALVLTNMRVSSLNVSLSMSWTIGAVPVPTGADGLRCTGMLRVKPAVWMNDPAAVYFSPTCRAISSVVRVDATPPLLCATSQMNPFRSSDLPTNVSFWT